MQMPRLFRSEADAITGGFAPSALSIGNFDGVHRGHQELFSRLCAWGREHQARPSVLTFDPHPTRVLAPARAPRLLGTMADRVAWMGEHGIEQILALPFSLEFASLSPEAFVERVIVKATGARLVVVGDNFCFGHRQSGNVATLRDLGGRFGFKTEIVSGVSYRGRAVSSTAVRALLDAGDVAAAARLLTRPYALRGEVVPGHGIGSKQTVPTLNLATTAEVIPAHGVYVTRVRDLDSARLWPSVTNIGVRPTFNQVEQALSIESFVLSGYSEPAPQHIAVEFLEFLREERKFPDPVELRRQILIDAGRAQRFHRRVDRWVK
jgi:riboflavin kinase / FMN adenylyltransferase